MLAARSKHTALLAGLFSCSENLCNCNIELVRYNAIQDGVADVISFASLWLARAKALDVFVKRTGSTRRSYLDQRGR